MNIKVAWTHFGPNFMTIIKYVTKNVNFATLYGNFYHIFTNLRLDLV